MLHWLTGHFLWLIFLHWPLGVVDGADCKGWRGWAFESRKPRSTAASALRRRPHPRPSSRSAMVVRPGNSHGRRRPNPWPSKYAPAAGHLRRAHPQISNYGACAWYLNPFSCRFLHLPSLWFLGLFCVQLLRSGRGGGAFVVAAAGGRGTTPSFYFWTQPGGDC